MRVDDDRGEPWLGNALVDSPNREAHRADQALASVALGDDLEGGLVVAVVGREILEFLGTRFRPDTRLDRGGHDVESHGGRDGEAFGGSLWRTKRRAGGEVRWSARRKEEVVLRLLRGEGLDALGRETGQQLEGSLPGVRSSLLPAVRA